MTKIEFPQEVIDKFIASMKEKLPTPVDDAILNDIIQTHIKIADDYLTSLQSTK